MNLQGYKVRKAAQVAAFFAMKEGAKQINVLKAVKLLYLSDREFLSRYDIPILWDRLVSLPKGPVNSITRNFVSGLDSDDSWDEFLTARENHLIGLRKADLSTLDLDELSKAELKTMEDVWARFGSMNGFELVEWTHKNCPEWEDPLFSSEAIPYERVLKFLQKPNASALAEAIEEDRTLVLS